MPKTQLPKEIDAKTAHGMVENGKAVLIDVREPMEHAGEHIEGSRLIPLSQWDATDFSELQDQHVVLYCRSGARTRGNAERFAAAGFAGASILGGGIGAWKREGLPTARGEGAGALGLLSGPIPMIALAIAIAGVGAGYMIDPMWAGLAAFIAFALFMARSR